MLPLLTEKTKPGFSPSLNHQKSSLAIENKIVATTILVTFARTTGQLFLGIWTPLKQGAKNNKFHDPGDVSFLFLLTVDFYYLTSSLSYRTGVRKLFLERAR